MGLPGRGLGWFALVPLGIGIAEWLANPNGRMMPTPNGWSNVCGPFGPHPAYPQVVHWRWSGPTGAPTCFAPLAGQPVGPAVRDKAPAAGQNELLYYYGPTPVLLPVERFYLYHQMWDALSGVPSLYQQRNIGTGREPVLYPSGADAPQIAPLANPMPVPIPVKYTPSIRPSPYPEAPERGDDRGPQRGGQASGQVFGRATPVVDWDAPGRNTLTVTNPSNTPRDRPPRPREKEKKLNGSKKAAQVMYWGAKAASAYGDLHGYVNALYYALPRSLRGRRGNVGNRMEVIYRNFDDIDWRQAAINVVVWKAFEQANARAEGAARRGARRMFDDPNETVYRNLQFASRRQGENLFAFGRADRATGRKSSRRKRGAQRRHRVARKARRRSRR